MKMPKDEAAAVQAADNLRPIEELAAEQKVPVWVLAGAKVHYEWGDGKEMTAAEFERAITKFMKSPMGGDR